MLELAYFKLHLDLKVRATFYKKLSVFIGVHLRLSAVKKLF